MKTVRILIVDDHDIVRRGVRALIQSQPAWQVCGEASTGCYAIEKAEHLKPDIVVLDANLPDISGTETTKEILKRLPGTEVLILTMDESPQLMRELLQAGARGYVFKSDLDHDLAEAITALTQHHPCFTSKVGQMMLDDFRDSQQRSSARTTAPLTERQSEVVRLLAEGNSNKEVASALGISIKTAETHRAAVMRKMGFRSFSELVRYAVSTGIVPPKPSGGGLTPRPSGTGS
ncbi:MAG: response regulator [Terriglobia bacterium]